MAKIGGDVAVWTLGGVSFIGLIENAELTIENSTEEGSGVNELWADPEVVGKAWRIEGEAHIETVAALTEEAAGDALLTAVFDTGANTYTGNVLVRTSSHQHNRRAMQKERFTLDGKGEVIIS